MLRGASVLMFAACALLACASSGEKPADDKPSNARVGSTKAASEMTPDELFVAMMVHQEAVLSIVEAHTSDPNAAADAVEQYAAANRSALDELGRAMRNIAPDQIEATLKAHEAEVKALTERSARLMSYEDLMKSERFLAAMSKLMPME